MASVVADAVKEKRRIVILRNSEPLFELVPLSKTDSDYWKFEIDYREEGRSTWMKRPKPSLR